MLKIERNATPSSCVFSMEKSNRISVAMTETSPSSALVNAVLSLRSQVPGNVSSETLMKIQNLRGILDSKTLTSARNGGDWRRGAANGGGSSGSLDSKWRHSSSNMRSGNGGGGMRNSASTSSLSNASVGSPTSPSTPKQGVYTGMPVGRYQSRFKNQAEPLEEKILNRIIRLKLNKFGPTTYTDIRDFLFQILGQESVTTEEGGAVQAEEGQVAEFVRDFMFMVFRKAATEQIYCPLYAKLLAEIGAKHSVIFEEMAILYENYMEIFEEADVNTLAVGNAAFEKKNVEKKYRQGYSQFLAELTALEILSMDCLARTIETLFEQMDKHSRINERKPLVEEYVDCLLRMSRVLKDKHTEFFRSARARILSDNQERLSDLINIRDSTYPSLSPKSRFLLMDIQDILLPK